MEALLPKGNSGSVGVEDELIVSLMNLVHYQLTILQSVDQRFLNRFLLIFTKELRLPLPQRSKPFSGFDFPTPLMA